MDTTLTPTVFIERINYVLSHSKRTDEWIEFGNVSRSVFDQQCQYGCRYTGLDIKGDGQLLDTDYGYLPEYPNLGRGLRWKGNCSDYHSILIHREDVLEFCNRYLKYQTTRWL
jgi:hypothetical protein